MVLSSRPAAPVRIGVVVLVSFIATLVGTVTFAQSTAAPLRIADVGAPALAGSGSTQCTAVACAMTVTAAGAGIGGTADQFTLAYREMTGDGVLVARVDSFQMGDGRATAGVMLRESLVAGSKYAFMFASADGTLAYQSRQSTNGASTSTPGVAGQASVWLKLERVGSTVTAYRSANGVAWVQIGSDTIAMSATLYAGLAVTSRDAALKASALFSAPVTTPLLPAGWQAIDIGGSAVKGSTAYAVGQFFQQARGGDVAGLSDKFRFAFREVNGDVDIIARVATLTNSNASVKAGILIRSSVSAGAANAALFSTAGNGVTFQRRTVNDSDTVSLNGGAGPLPVWFKLERRGDRVTAFRSSDGSAWTYVGEDSMVLPTRVYVGVGLASRDAAAVPSAVYDNVTVRPVVPKNLPPTVSLTSPASGFVASTGTSVALTATASDRDGSVAAVDFLVNGTLVVSDASAPYAADWVPVAGGTYVVTAVARDDAGESATSTPATVTIQAPAPRILTFEQSPDHETLVDFYQLEIFSSANGTNGSAALVQSIGKPAVVVGQISVDVSALITSLPAGSYIAVVDAVGAGGLGRSAESPPFTR